MNLLPIAYIICLSALVAGVIYAYLIYHHPSPDGWTWVSVLGGEILTEGTATGLLLLFLIYKDLWPEYSWLLLIPWLAEALPGLPMIVGQVFKWQRQRRDNNRLVETYRRTKDR